MSKLFLKCIFLLMLFSSCHRPIIGQSQDVIIVDSIRKENNFGFAVKGLVRVGFSEPYSSDVGMLRESYQTRKVIFIKRDEARNYFVRIFNEYVKPFNANNRLKVLAKNFPFDPGNTEIQITFLDEHGTPPAPPYIARIRNSSGKILIYSYDSESGLYTQIADEPFI